MKQSVEHDIGQQINRQQVKAIEQEHHEHRLEQLLAAHSAVFALLLACLVGLGVYVTFSAVQIRDYSGGIWSVFG